MAEIRAAVDRGSASRFAWKTSRSTRRSAATARPGARRQDRADALQRRRAGHGGIRHGARRDPRGGRASGKKIDVFADETRPFLQGARLTVWELQQDGIPTTLITDNMAGHFLKSGRIGCVVVGADRIAANGDVANKIGTYSVAVLAKENGVPFFVAAPISTLDLTLASGDRFRSSSGPDEVTHVFGVAVAPEDIVANPAFDVTPSATSPRSSRNGAWRARRTKNRCGNYDDVGPVRHRCFSAGCSINI